MVHNCLLVGGIPTPLTNSYIFPGGWYTTNQVIFHGKGGMKVGFAESIDDIWPIFPNGKSTKNWGQSTGYHLLVRFT